MNKKIVYIVVFGILVSVGILTLVLAASSGASNLDLIFADGTTTINATNICVVDGTCLISNIGIGITGTYDFNGCWLNISKGVVIGTNCSEV